MGCASKISEVYLLPVLEAVLAQFPFMVLGFQVDNGSEYVNHRVAKMLDKPQSGQRAGRRQQTSACFCATGSLPHYARRAATGRRMD